MSNRGNAYAIALAIYAGTADQPFVDIDHLTDRLYVTIEALGLGADEIKADIYAQLAETLTLDTKFEDAVLIIEAAIKETQLHG